MLRCGSSGQGLRPWSVRCSEFVLVVAAGVVFIASASADAQMLNARRLGMGGVITSDTHGLATANVAFHAVPGGQGIGNFPLPFGLIQFLGDMPEFDPEDENFNIFELVDLAMNPPLNLSLSGPKTVSSDIAISVAKDSLLIDLKDLQRVVPDEALVSSTVRHFPGYGMDIGPFLVHAYPLVHVRSSFDVNDELRSALGDAVAFKANSNYEVMGDARAQTAIALQADYAFCAFHDNPLGEEVMPIDPRYDHSTALYLGIGPKFLMGLGFGDTEGIGTAVTGDTLFAADDPLAFEMEAITRYAYIFGDGGMGAGQGADLGAVFYWDNFEFGVGFNDVASEIRWQPTVEQHRYDDVTDEFITDEIARGERFTARVPVTTTINLAKRIGRTTIAADVVDTEVRTTMHAGVEHWRNRFALRGGVYRDQNKQWQMTVGAGKRFGKYGLDFAIATHSRNIMLERGTELSVSIARY